MNTATNSADRAARKPRRFAWMLEEWVFHAALVAGVVSVLVDSVVRLSVPTV